MSLINKVRRTIRQYQLIRPGDTIMIGVSGGPDSVALLHVLHQLRHELGLKLSVAHVNHQLRRGADADQRFVQRLCDSLQVSCSTVKVHVRNPHTKGSLEDIAREKRFNGLIRLAKQKKAEAIALAHHQDDLAETVLMRILRGSGLLGLQGILPKRKIKDFPVIRPFIDIKREEIEHFLKIRKLKFRTDPTNKQTRFFRNKIRLELLPLLKKKYNPNINAVLAHLANNVTVDYDYLNCEGQRLLKKLVKKPALKGRVRFPLAPFARLHPSSQRMMLRLAFQQLKGHMKGLTLTHWQEIEDLIKNRPTGSIVHLPAGAHIQKVKSSLTLTAK